MVKKHKRNMKPKITPAKKVQSQTTQDSRKLPTSSDVSSPSSDVLVPAGDRPGTPRSVDRRTKERRRQPQRSTRESDSEAARSGSDDVRYSLASPVLQQRPSNGYETAESTDGERTDDDNNGVDASRRSDTATGKGANGDGRHLFHNCL